ncbi:MAG: hypothetical protein HYY31_00005, partial [Chloroflexi bacterium]|nr:hypothetical protein [Chloroflexota bacterium]
MGNVVLWVLTVELVGLLAFPVTYRLFRSLKDRGYAFSKPLGLLIVSYGVWLPGSLHLVPAMQWTVLAMLLLLGGLSALLLRQRWREFRAYLWGHRYLLLATEGVFLCVFLLWTAYRAYDPD